MNIIFLTEPDLNLSQNSAPLYWSILKFIGCSESCIMKNLKYLIKMLSCDFIIAIHISSCRGPSFKARLNLIYDIISLFSGAPQTIYHKFSFSPQNVLLFHYLYHLYICQEVAKPSICPILVSLSHCIAPEYYLNERILTFWTVEKFSNRKIQAKQLIYFIAIMGLFSHFD